MRSTSRRQPHTLISGVVAPLALAIALVGPRTAMAAERPAPKPDSVETPRPAADPYVKSISVQFFTRNDDKDFDTSYSTSIAVGGVNKATFVKSCPTVIRTPGCYYADFSYSPEYDYVQTGEISKSDYARAIFAIRFTNVVGRDEWVMTAVVTTWFSDGTGQRNRMEFHMKDYTIYTSAPFGTP